jgi:hypothetical protein
MRTPPPLPTTPTALDPRVVGTWRTASLLALPVYAALIVAVARWRELSWGTSAAIGLGLGALLTILDIWRDHVRYRRWRWHLDDVAVVVRHGGLVQHETTIPRFRLQQVDVTRGPVERRAGLASIVLHVAGDGEHTIPGLALETADALRDALIGTLHAQWEAEQREQIADERNTDEPS